MAVEKTDSKTAQAGADQAKVVKKTTKTGLPKQTTDQATMVLAENWYGPLNHAEGHQLRKRVAPAPAPAPAPAAKKAAKKTTKPAAKKAAKK